MSSRHDGCLIVNKKTHDFQTRRQTFRRRDTNQLLTLNGAI
jgi:hypothetical protein